MSDTPCKNCIFAAYDEDTQIGCHLGKLDVYRKRGAEILECYDQDREFYVIKDRQCPHFRNLKWLLGVRKVHGDDVDYKQKVKQENILSFHVIVLANRSMEKLASTLQSLLDTLGVHPVQVTVMLPAGSKLKPSEIRTKVQKQEPKFKLRIQQLVVKTRDRQAIHMAQKSCPKVNFYCVCHAGYSFDPLVFAKVNYFVIEDLYQFAMYEDADDKYGMKIIPLPVHEYWHFQGDHSKSIPENIRDFQCQNKNKKVIYGKKHLPSLSLESWLRSGEMEEKKTTSKASMKE